MFVAFQHCMLRVAVVALSTVGKSLKMINFTDEIKCCSSDDDGDNTNNLPISSSWKMSMSSAKRKRMKQKALTMNFNKINRKCLPMSSTLNRNSRKHHDNNENSVKNNENIWPNMIDNEMEWHIDSGSSSGSGSYKQQTNSASLVNYTNLPIPDSPSKLHISDCSDDESQQLRNLNITPIYSAKRLKLQALSVKRNEKRTPLSPRRHMNMLNRDSYETPTKWEYSDKQYLAASNVTPSTPEQQNMDIYKTPTNRKHNDKRYLASTIEDPDSDTQPEQDTKELDLLLDLIRAQDYENSAQKSTTKRRRKTKRHCAGGYVDQFRSTLLQARLQRRLLGHDRFSNRIRGMMLRVQDTCESFGVHLARVQHIIDYNNDGVHDVGKQVAVENNFSIILSDSMAARVKIGSCLEAFFEQPPLLVDKEKIYVQPYRLILLTKD